MKKSVQTLLALAAFGLSSMLLQAQPAPSIRVIDMAKLYDSHYKTEEQNAKLRGDEQKAQEELDRLNKEGNALVEKYKDMVDQSNNPAATVDAKAKAQAESNKMLEDIRRKKGEVENFQNNTRNSLQQRIKTFRDLMIEEISKIAVDVAKRKGATILIDKSGPTLIGVSNVLYADAAYDITEDVLTEINRDRPTTATAAATSTPAASTKTESSNSDSPKITLPGVAPVKKP